VSGGSDRQFQTLALYLYEIGFTRFDFGFASASAWVMFGVIVVAAAINFTLISRLRRS
jgi:cellobiose transport system permease protein